MVLNAGYNKDPHMMHLINCLFFVLAGWDISLYACHILVGIGYGCGYHHELQYLFLSCEIIDTNPHRIPILTNLVELLLTHQLGWILPS